MLARCGVFISLWTRAVSESERSGQHNEHSNRCGTRSTRGECKACFYCCLISFWGNTHIENSYGRSLRAWEHNTENMMKLQCLQGFSEYGPKRETPLHSPNSPPLLASLCSILVNTGTLGKICIQVLNNLLWRWLLPFFHYSPSKEKHNWKMNFLEDISKGSLEEYILQWQW